MLIHSLCLVSFIGNCRFKHSFLKNKTTLNCDLFLAGDNQCVAMGSRNVSGLWYTLPCTTQFGVICELSRVGYTAPPQPYFTPAKVQCAAGLIQTDNYCYQVIIQVLLGCNETIDNISYNILCPCVWQNVFRHF